MSELTPQDLYAAVKPLWDRDAVFKPLHLEFSHNHACWRSDVWPDGVHLHDETATALIRDRIVERLGELGYEIRQVLEWATGWSVFACVDGGIVRDAEGYNPDRTLALIAAAMKATEP